MNYVKMRLEYFKYIESLLDYNVFVRMYLDVCSIPIIEIIRYTEHGEEIIMRSDITNSVSKNILDLVHEISTRINGGVMPFPQYAKKSIRRKALDNVLALDYEIYFYKLIDDSILGTISKRYKNEVYDILITTNDTLKSVFESLDAEISKKYGYFVNFCPENGSTFAEFSSEIIKRRRILESSIRPQKC